MATATLNATARQRFGYLIGEPVIVTFSDDAQEAGTLVEAGWDMIAVEHYDDGITWTARYSLTGDDETPHVTNVRMDMPQTESLF